MCQKFQRLVFVACGRRTYGDDQYKIREKVTKKKLIKALKNFKNPIEKFNLPSAPKPFITYFAEENRPQQNLIEIYVVVWVLVSGEFVKILF